MTKRRKRKLKKKRIVILILILIVIVSATVYLMIPKRYGYQKEVIEVFKETNTYEKLKEKKIYSKTP